MTGSSWKAIGCRRWRWVTPTPTTPQSARGLDRLVVAGDVAYNGVHQYLLESAHGGSKRGWPHSTRSRRCSPAPWSQATRTALCPTIRRSSTRPRIPARRAAPAGRKAQPRDYFDRMLALTGPTQRRPGVVHRGLAAAGATERLRRSVTRSRAGSSTTTWPPGSASARDDRARARIHPGLLVCAAALARRRVNRWVLDGADVVGVLNDTHSRMRDAGYAHTEVVDRGVRAYHGDGAAIEVIWSRRRGDGSEIERVAAHFEVVRDAQRMASRQHPGRIDHQRLTQGRMAASLLSKGDNNDHRPRRSRPDVDYKLLIGSVLPRAIAWVSTSSTTGVGNIAPISFVTVVGRFPPVLSITLQPRSDGETLKDTFVNIRVTERIRGEHRVDRAG